MSDTNSNSKKEASPSAEPEPEKADVTVEGKEGAEAERVRLEKEVADLEAEKKRIEEEQAREEVAKKAEKLNKLLNPDSSDDETPDPDPPKQTDTAPKVPFWDFALSNLLVGLGTLKIDGTATYCGSCQKNLELDSLKQHLEGDGHKLNTLWNYDKSLAEVTGELRSYPQKFEMEMFKHITMLNRMERRYDVQPHVDSVIREIFKEPEKPAKVEEEKNSETPISPAISPEELAEIKAEFIGSFATADASILVQQALMGELHGFSSESRAQTALKIAGSLGKLISAYQRKHLNDGYKVNEECIRDIKGQCGKLLKHIDEAKLQPHHPH